MRSILFGAFLVFGLIARAFSQDSASPLTTLESRFDTGTVDEKIGVLAESVRYPETTMTPLYEKALRYLIDSPALLMGQPAGDNLALAALALVAKARDTKAAQLVWRTFELASNPRVRSAALDSMAVVGTGDPSLPKNLNDWLAGENVLHQSGSPVDVSIIGGVLKLIGRVGSPTSLGVVFSTMTAGYGKETDAAARTALDSLKGDLTQPLEKVVAGGQWIDRRAALAYAMSNKRLSPVEKAGVATEALTAALHALSESAPPLEAQLGLLDDATVDLGSLRWAPSVAVMIQALNYAIQEYDANQLSAAHLVHFIDAVGATATHEAAVRLTLYLDLMDSKVQRGQQYDVPVVLAVISNLGRLGDPVAAGDLLAVGHLDYPQSVKNAAREAFDNLGS